MSKRNLKKLVKELKTLLKNDETNVSAKLELAEALQSLGRIEEALVYYREVARAFFKVGNTVQAKSVCSHILELAPQDEEFSKLHRALSKDGEKASSHLNIEDNPADLQSQRGPSHGGMPLGRLNLKKRAVRRVKVKRLGDDSDKSHEKTPERLIQREVLQASSVDEEKIALNAEEKAAFDELFSELPIVTDDALEKKELIRLQEIPLLRDLPPDALEELRSKLVFREESAESIVVKEGDPGNAFFFVLSGGMRVEKTSKNGEIIPIAALGPGSFFGEFALLSDRKRHASVVAEVPSEVLEISRKVIGRLARKHGLVAKTLRRFYRKRLLDTLIRSTPFFSPLSEEELKALLGRLRFRRFGPGDLIVEEGTQGGGFYLILIGEVKVEKRVGSESKVLARMGEGSYFGEMSLLKERPAGASVIAVSHTEVVELDAQDFYKILGDYPQIWQDVNKEARRRELVNYALLTGKTDRIITPDGGTVI